MRRPRPSRGVNRSLRNLFEKAVERMKRRDSPPIELMFDDLFQAAAAEARQFMTAHQVEMRMLQDKFIELD